MNALPHKGAEGFLARFAEMRAQLPGDAAAREAAAAHFRALGLPGLRNEAWKFTSLRPLAEAAFSAGPEAEASALLALMPDLAAPRLVLLDGAYRPEFSTPPAGTIVTSFAAAPHFGPHARPEREPLVALNTMLAEDGIRIEVPAGHDAGLVVLATLTSGAHDAGAARAIHPRHRIHLGPGARLSLLDLAAGGGTYLHNPVYEMTVAEGARLVHVRLQDESAAGFHLATLYADIATGGTYDSFSLALGGRLARAEVHATLAGPDAAAHLNAAQLLGGTQHADFTTVIRHAAPRCASRQTVKNVLAGRARGVFQGRIEVARGAQKTDGYQMSQALLLSPDAEVDCKPELEIYADDVKCSHGTTVGELDAEQIFYLRSRGIPETAARAMLIRAFLAGALETIADEAVRAVLDARIGAWWERHRA